MQLSSLKSPVASRPARLKVTNSDALGNVWKQLAHFMRGWFRAPYQSSGCIVVEKNDNLEKVRKLQTKRLVVQFRSLNLRISGQIKHSNSTLTFGRRHGLLQFSF